jgi:hypothetical protein
MELKNPTTVNSSWNSEIRSNMKHENILYSLSIVRYLTTTKKDFIPLSEIHREDSERSMKKKSVFFDRRIRTHKLYYNIFKLGNKCIKKVELDTMICLALLIGYHTSFERLGLLEFEVFWRYICSTLSICFF